MGHMGCGVGNTDAGAGAVLKQSKFPTHLPVHAMLLDFVVTLSGSKLHAKSDVYDCLLPTNLCTHRCLKHDAILGWLIY